MVKPKKICFISFFSFPVLSQSISEVVGGAELQQGILAGELVKKDYDVCLLVPDRRQGLYQLIEGLKLYKSLPEGLTQKKLVNKLYRYPFIPAIIWRRLSLADSQIYFQKMVGATSALVAFFCWVKRRKYIYCVASDDEVDGTYIKNRKFPLSWLTQSAIRNADGIIAQTSHQQKLLKLNFNRDSTVIKSMCLIPDSLPPKEHPPVVLWVGSMRKVKCPELFLKLATALPEIKFRMIGGASPWEDPDYFEMLKQGANNIPNLEFMGFIPYQEVTHYFATASILVNTSDFEGFPNTFLQAWSRFTPVISLNVNPDEIISRYGLGCYSQTFDQMVKDVQSLVHNESLRKEIAEQSRKYVEQEHSTRNIVPRYIDFFEQLLR